ncbi:hypothetical protein PGQ11_007987 [Apiospora arundinis]|uniref:Uncharacterized protein n=1 Tax=Apiospora arundinis TaxID=335852 RepID=A0ABR2IXY4_9PEZI
MNGYLYNDSKAELGLTRMPQVRTLPMGAAGRQRGYIFLPCSYSLPSILADTCTAVFHFARRKCARHACLALGTECARETRQPRRSRVVHLGQADGRVCPDRTPSHGCIGQMWIHVIEITSETFRGSNMLKQQRMVNAALETRSSHGMASNYEQRYPPEYGPNLEFSNKGWVKRETCRGGGTQLYNIIITVECILSPTRASPGCLGLGPFTPTELDRATCTYLYTTSTNRRYVKDKNVQGLARHDLLAHSGLDDDLEHLA